MQMMTQSLEDYLEAVWVLLSDGKRARVSDVAGLLHVTMPSVHKAMDELKARGLVQQVPYHDLQLTEKGQKLAMAVFSRHRMLMAFLEKIGVSAKTAEKDACLMEHILSAETLDHIKAFLATPADPS